MGVLSVHHSLLLLRQPHRYVIKYFSLYSVYIQCEGFAKLTLYHLAALLQATTAHTEEMVALRRETEQHKTRNARLTADMEEMHELMGLVDLSAVSGGGGERKETDRDR